MYYTEENKTYKQMHKVQPTNAPSLKNVNEKLGPNSECVIRHLIYMQRYHSPMFTGTERH